MPNHVHLLLSIPPKYSVSSIMGYLKGKSVVDVSNIGYTFAAQESDLSRGGWRFASGASKYDPTLTERIKYNGFRLFGRPVQTAFHVT